MINKMKRIVQMSLSRKIQYFLMKKNAILTFVLYKNRMIKCGKKSIIFKPLFWTPEYVDCGHNVLVWPGSRLEAITEYNGTMFNPELKIGDNTSFQQNCHITFSMNLIIGKNVTVLFDVLITDIDHKYEMLDVNILNQPILVKTTKIGDNCFIGSGAKIQAGTILGKQCIVGANAVVRGVFPDYCVIVGIPAKIIKRYDFNSKQWLKTDINGDFIK